MSLFKRRQEQRGDYYRSERPTVSFISPYRIMSIRKFWLVFMLLLGMFSQFLMAIYVPEVWNYLYDLIQNLMPAL